MARVIKKYSKQAVILSLILIMIICYIFTSSVRAGTVTSRKDQLSDSRPSTAANHTISFTTVTAAGTDDTITITFDSAFDTSTITEDDVDITSAGDELTTAVDCSGGEDLSAAMAADVLTFTVCSEGNNKIGASEAVVIEIGNHATASGTGSNQIVNPALLGCTGPSSVCDINVGGTHDSGKMQVAIISGVTVSATVPESLSFTIAGVTEANCDSSFSDLDGPDPTSATAVAFGSLAATDTFYHGCQDLTVSTNANSGYTVTVQETTNLRDSSISKNISDTTGDNGLMSESVSDTWATAAAHSGLGISCVNIDGTDCVFSYTNYRQMACVGSDANCDPDTGGETARGVMSNVGAVSAKKSRIEYKLSVSGLQQAGTYSNVVVYIATPTY